MLGFVRNILRGGFTTASADPATEAIEAATPRSDTLPPDLVAAIEAASVVWRYFEGNADKDEASYSSAVVAHRRLGWHVAFRWHRRGCRAGPKTLP